MEVAIEENARRGVDVPSGLVLDLEGECQARIAASEKFRLSDLDGHASIIVGDGH